MKPADITEDALWKERQEQIDVKVTDDPFVPAKLAPPTTQKVKMVICGVEKEFEQESVVKVVL